MGCVPRRAAARPPARTAARAADEGLASDLGLDSARVERLEGQQDTPSLPSLRGGRQRVLPHERKDRATPFYGRAFVPWEAPSKRLEVNSPHRSIEELVAAAGLEVVALEGDPTLEVRCLGVSECRRKASGEGWLALPGPRRRHFSVLETPRPGERGTWAREARAAAPTPHPLQLPAGCDGSPSPRACLSLARALPSRDRRPCF